MLSFLFFFLIEVKLLNNSIESLGSCSFLQSFESTEKYVKIQGTALTGTLFSLNGKAVTGALLTVLM